MKPLDPYLKARRARTIKDLEEQLTPALRKTLPTVPPKKRCPVCGRTTGFFALSSATPDWCSDCHGFPWKQDIL